MKALSPRALWIGGGVLLAGLAAVLTIALWPASATEKARNDGEAVGTAVVDLQNATTSSEVDNALADLRTALSNTRDNAGDRVADQVDDQADALDRAAEGWAGTHSSDDAWDVDLYQAELNGALDDLSSNASDFRTEGPEVQQAFWEGYQSAVA